MTIKLVFVMIASAEGIIANLMWSSRI